jgi:hypothetical protein
VSTSADGGYVSTASGEWHLDSHPADDLDDFG